MFNAPNMTVQVENIVTWLVYENETVGTVARRLGVSKAALLAECRTGLLGRELRAAMASKTALALIQPMANLAVRQAERQKLYNMALADGDRAEARKILADAGREMSAGEDVQTRVGIVVNVMPHDGDGTDGQQAGQPVQPVSVTIVEHSSHVDIPEAD